MSRLEAWLYDRAEVLLGLFNGVFLGLLLALSLGWRDTTTQAKWWEVASALGTLFAALIALWIWVHGQIQRRRDDLNRGRIAAAILRAPFLGIKIAMGSLLEDLKNAPDRFREKKEIRFAWRDHLRQWRAQITDSSLRDAAPLLIDGKDLYDAIVGVDSLLGALGVETEIGNEGVSKTIPKVIGLAALSDRLLKEFSRLTAAGI